MDAFIAAAEEARARMIRTEGANVSWREVIRRTGREDKRGTIMHHLNKNKWVHGRHQVPPDVVEILAGVLPVSHEELVRAAQTAAGYTVADLSRPDVNVLTRYLGDEDVSDEEKNEIVEEVLRAIANNMGRRR
jgi:hypothetical protein